MSFTYALKLLNFITDAHPANFSLKGMSLPIDITLETQADNKWTLSVSLQTVTLDELSIDFGEIFPWVPMSTIWNILAGNKGDQTYLLNSIIGIINPTLSAQKINYNMPVKTNIKGIDVELRLTEPIKFENMNNSGDWNIKMKSGVELGYNGEIAPNVYTPDIDMKTTDTKNTHLFVSSNIVNNLLWAVYKSGLGQISVSQKTLDSLKVDLLRLYTDDVTILFMNILSKYQPKKGLYMNVDLKDYDTSSTRVKMVQGRLGILIKADLQVFVDTDSTNYPQEFSECTSCEMAAHMDVEAFIGTSASFTNDKHLWFTSPEIDIYSLVLKSSTFDINIAMFKDQINSMASSIANGIENAIDVSQGVIGDLNPKIDILGELLHIQLG